MFRFEYASDQSLMVYLGDGINLETHHRVLKLLRMLETASIPGIRNLHPAYNSLLIVFDPVELEHAYVQHTVSMCIEEIDSIVLPPPRVVEIPVVYDGLRISTTVAALHRITAQRVVELHSSSELRRLLRGIRPRLRVSRRVARKNWQRRAWKLRASECRKEAWRSEGRTPESIRSKPPGAGV